MSNKDAFERIIAALHEAMFDDAHWVTTSGLIDEACRTEGSILAVGDDSARIDGVLFTNFCYRGQRHREWEREYFSDYYPIDEHLRRYRHLRDSRIVHVTDLFSAEELKTSVVYNDGMRRIHAQNSLKVRLDGPDRSRILWTIGDPTDGNGWSSEQIELIARLLPHLRQFVRVRHALAGTGAFPASLGRLLDNTRAGVVQLDRHGRIAAANDCALELLCQGDPLSDRNGSLGARLPAENTKLQMLLGRALPRYGDRGVSGSMVLTRLTGAPAVVLHVIPTDDAAMAFRSPGVAALLLLIDLKKPPRVEPNLVAAAFRLTAAESVVAALLAEGHAVRDIVAKTGRGENTVRWHVKHILKKLGVSRQAEVVRLVSSVADSLGTRR